MKYFAVFLFTLFTFLFVSSGTGHAVNLFLACDDPAVSDSSVCKDQSRPIAISGNDSLLSRVVGVLALIIGFSGVLLMIWGGMNYIMANGDSQRVAKAKDTILFASIGLIIAIFARVIIGFALARIGT